MQISKMPPFRREAASQNERTIMDLLRVRNWDKWQYRSDRKLPWIRVYRDLLFDPTFLELSDEERGHILCIWLAASANNGCIPSEKNTVKTLINSEKIPNINKFISLQLLEIVGKRGRPKKRSQGAPIESRREEIEEKKKTSKKEKKIDLPDWLPPEVWKAWEDYRREKRKALTPSTAQRQIDLLAKLLEEGYDPQTVIDQSITHGWQGLFPPKGNTHDFELDGADL